jgi:hypothetical protein
MNVLTYETVYVSSRKLLEEWRLLGCYVVWLL